MRYLILEYLGIIRDTVTFRVKDQSHREYDFFPPDERFLASNNFSVVSDSCPAWYEPTIVYVRGAYKTADNNRVKVPVPIWNKIKIAVRDYNNYFGYEGESIIGELKPIPMEMFAL